ncbi:MAG TPA: c-type cytochrome domain-containing protein, partial [Planctomycetaceae bacterium]|nr:c-type cytochrome domain-containing protein [Planctomycetaceae bacterium]
MSFKRQLLPQYLAALTIAASSSLLAAEATAPDPAKLEFFEKKIRPLLAENCYNCHSADNKAAGGLRVDDRNGLLQGGNRGAAVVVGDLDRSVILKAVRHTDEKLKMPPDNRLTDEQIADL